MSLPSDFGTHGPAHAGRSPGAWAVLALAMIAGVVLFYELGDFRTFGSHEVLAAVPARGMLGSGNWVVPIYGGLPRLQKPPLSYWVIAASGSIFGEVNEWTARLPAAIAAVLLAVLMGAWAGRWYGRGAGFGAALVQITSVYVVIFGRKAEVDMLLCLLTTAAMSLIAGQVCSPRSRRAGGVSPPIPAHISIGTVGGLTPPARRDESGSSVVRRLCCLQWTGVYALLALAWLAKFHYGPVMVLAPVVLFLLIQRRPGGLLHLANPVGLVLLAAAVVVWPSLLLEQVPNAWDVWKAETLGRAVGDLGRQPWWFYFPHLVSLSLPWTPLAVAAMPESWRRAWRDGDSRERFLWVWLATPLVIVTLSANKHQHYLLSALPVFSLLAGQTFASLAARARQGRPLLRWPWALSHSTGCVGTAVVAAVVVARKWPDLTAAAIAVAVMLALGGLAALWLLVARKTRPAWACAAAACLGCYILVVGWLVPGRDHRLAPARFSREVRDDLPPGVTISTYRMGMSPEVFYLGDLVRRLESPEAALDQLVRERRLHVVTWDYLALELGQLGRARVVRTMPTDSSLPASKRPPLVLVELTKR